MAQIAGSGARDKRLHGARDQDFAWPGQGDDPGADVHGHTGHPGSVPLDLASVQPGSYLQAELRDGVSYRTSAADGACRGVEGGEESIPRGVDFGAVEAID